MDSFKCNFSSVTAGNNNNNCGCVTEYSEILHSTSNSLYSHRCEHFHIPTTSPPSSDNGSTSTDIVSLMNSYDQDRQAHHHSRRDYPGTYTSDVYNQGAYSQDNVPFERYIFHDTLPNARYGSTLRREVSSRHNPQQNVRPVQRNFQEARYKTELCLHYRERNACPHGAGCLFAHGLSELRPYRGRHPRHKTQPCRQFHQNAFCNYGYRCAFIHTETPGTLRYLRSINESENHARNQRINHFARQTRSNPLNFD